MTNTKASIVFRYSENLLNCIFSNETDTEMEQSKTHAIKNTCKTTIFINMCTICHQGKGWDAVYRSETDGLHVDEAEPQAMQAGKCFIGDTTPLILRSSTYS